MDVAIIETLNGGDILIKGEDLAKQGGWGNMPYLAMFGGNYEAVTKKREKGEIVKDWWGNVLLFNEDSGQQFNSRTEKALNNIALNSAGRIQLEQIVKDDLKFMLPFAIIEVQVVLVSDDKIKILIKIKQKTDIDNQYKEYIYFWNKTTQILIGDFDFNDFNDDFFV